MLLYCAILVCLYWTTTSQADSGTGSSAELGNNFDEHGSFLTESSQKVLEYQKSIRIESFRDWAQWKDRYLQCNSENNAYQTPIQISKKQIVTAPSMRGIFIHSNLPVDDCLSLSVLYTKEDFEMEAVTLNALPACSEQLTYISGGGDKPLDLRYFRRAVFFFTNTQVEPERSLHQVLGETFNMEIMMEFASSNGADYTQLFVLVEIKPPEATYANPIFTILEPALHELKEEVDNEVLGKTGRSQRYKELKDSCYENEAKYLQIQAEMGNILARLEKVKTVISNIKGITNNQFESLVIEASNSNKVGNSTNTGNMSVPSSSTLTPLEQKLIQLREQKSKIFDMMQKEEEQWAFDKLRYLYEKVDGYINKVELLNVTIELENTKQLLKANNVGIPGEDPFEGMLFESPDAVHEQLKHIQNKCDEGDKSAELYRKSCEEFLEFQKEPYAFVDVKQPFQISWLFPQTGGYYLYNGSNPIPDCTPRDRTIVFEEHIAISTEQLHCFLNISSVRDITENGTITSNQNQSRDESTSGDGKSTLDKMIPVLADSETDRTVWYVDKNPVYIRDDGFHGKSLQIRQGKVNNEDGALVKNRKAFAVRRVPNFYAVTICVAIIVGF